ncbi:circularly permuted type 2 ATP-grasp protein [Nitrincola iocasae]|uniref:Circularly permuted type 2 ATP-grasp protein n=1 Tax=Nitrincola iocasae TaxID=2614693 RepID=A0A5J6L9Y3_9GAMM|nr:circularly permuted type 2 ATP-grasp protein [Nitrincola iocasae]QEW05424.1 circularly permuted type 2 ATP-grasp protein [Nitrincola iocasae]
MSDLNSLNTDMQQRLKAYLQQRIQGGHALAGYDELLNADQRIRAHWQPVLDELSKFDREGLRSRCDEAQNLLHENGVTFNTYEDEPGQLRSWQLDSLPYVISTETWDHLERGLMQRSRLLEAIAQDLYGPRTLINTGLLPPELIHSFPSYLLPAVNVTGNQARPMLIFHGTDLIRNAEGEWQVLCDWTQSPSGAGYALENRITLARALPSLYREAPLKRLAGFLQAQHRTLASLCTTQREQPNIVLLSPGPGSPGYFEHAWLANYMNFSLVEGADLVVRDGHVSMRTLGGLRQVDVIVRQINDPWCDPLELRSDSLLGVPGLMQAARDGDVEIANALGSGILEHPALAAYMEEICQRLLGESLLLQNRLTLWAGDAAHLSRLLTSPQQWLYRDITEPAKLIRPDKLSAGAFSQLLVAIQANPHRYVAQAKLQAATSPVYNTRSDQFEAHNINLRFFSLIEPDHLFSSPDKRLYRIMPGGLAWVGEPGTLLMESHMVKDIWVMAPVPQPHISMLRQANGPIVVTRDGNDLPCRVADSLFWLGRYGERLDIRSRLLRETLGRFLQEDQSAEDSGLLPDLFTALEVELTEDLDTPENLTEAPPGYKHTYLIYRNRLLELFEEHHSDGMPWLFSHFLRNCRAVRDHLGDDAWRTVNGLRQRFNDMPRTQGIIVGQRQLEGVVTDLAAFFGLCNETMPHHYGWRFLDIGRFIERVLCTLELLKLALLSARQPGIPLCEVVLATTDNFTVYRRRYRSQLHPSAILDLLLFDETNPRSVGYMLKRLERQIQRLPQPGSTPYRNQETRLVIQATSALHLVDIDQLSDVENSEASRAALESLLDSLIAPLSELTNAISHSHFSHVEAPIQLVTMQS